MLITSLEDNILWRMEARLLNSKDNIFESDNTLRHQNAYLTTSLNRLFLMTEKDKNVQHFLDLIKKSRRGKFKIYIGMSAGVGQNLSDAQGSAHTFTQRYRRQNRLC